LYCSNCIQIVKYEFVHGTNSYKRILTIVCGFCTNSYNFYTNCIVGIHTKCDFYVFPKSVQTSRERTAQAARVKPKLQARNASRERAARATWAKPKLQARSASRECAARAASAKPELQARSASHEGEAQAHLLPQPGRTLLPRPLGFTRLTQPVRVRSWGGWVRNGIKVYNLYYRLPQLLGYTRLPQPLGYTRLPQYTNSYSTICIIIRPSKK
jgi:hypothetical protein